MLTIARAAGMAAMLSFAVALAPTPAHAKTCKAEVMARSTSKAELSDREARARSGALANWRTKAQRANGVAYRFWSRADGKTLTCKSTDSATTCVAIGKPCRLI